MFRYRIAYILFLAAAVLLYLFDSGYLAFYLLAVMIALPVLSWLLTLLSVRGTAVSLELETPYAARNEEALLRVRLKNRAFFPVAQAELRFRFENLFFGEERTERLFLPVSSGPEQTVEYRFKSLHCGEIAVTLVKTVYFDYFGIFSISPKAGQSALLFVAPVPRVLDTVVDTTADPGAESNTYSKYKPGDDPSEIFDIRAYREGDPMRSVHWKLSSRMDELMVKEFSLPTDSSVLLLAELTGGMGAIDTLFETLVSLSGLLLENELRHSVGWYDARRELYREATIENDEDLAVSLNAMLSSRRYTESPRAMEACRLLNNPARPYPHLIYLTGALTPELTDFCESREEAVRTTVLLCGAEKDGRADTAAALRSNRTEIIRIDPEKIQESLSGLMI